MRFHSCGVVGRRACPAKPSSISELPDRSQAKPREFRGDTRGADGYMWKIRFYWQINHRKLVIGVKMNTKSSKCVWMTCKKLAKRERHVYSFPGVQRGWYWHFPVDYAISSDKSSGRGLNVKWLIDFVSRSRRDVNINEHTNEAIKMHV